MKSSKKPIWPHVNITPMSAHVGAGQWYRTHKGKPVYFGVLRDPDGALKRYLEWARKTAAKDPIGKVPSPEAVTLHLGVNHFLTAREQDTREGNLSPGQYVRYRRAGLQLFDVFGRETLVTDLTPGHFARLRAKFEGNPVTIGNAIRDVRAIFNFIDRHYRVRPAYGDAFKKPGKRAIRSAGDRVELWTPQELRQLLKACEPPIRAMILLGINCGFGQTDCALFPRTHFNLEHHWFPRPKTLIERRCPLWPSTMAAIADYRRPRPDLYPQLVFLSKYGRVLVRDDPVENRHGQIVKVRRKDAVYQMLRRACEDAGVKMRGFYSLRHTFRSVADTAGDATAVRCIMGRELGEGSDATYVQLMAGGMKRLRAVTDVVLDWLHS